MFFSCKPFILASTLFTLASFNVQSTVVEIQTTQGAIQVNLFDQSTPNTVTNFLSYVNSGSYASSVVHRSVNNFVIQGGGFTYTGPIALENFDMDRIPTGSPVGNEPKWSNVRGTIAMAKNSNPDSATSQWFINLSNNASSLDVASNAGGFTVFGQVIGDGMQVVDAIADATRLNAGGTFSEIPVQNYTQSDVDNNIAITDENLFVVTDIVVIDTDVESAANLQPAVNTLINNQNQVEGSGSGGGSMSWMLVSVLLMMTRKFSR